MLTFAAGLAAAIASGVAPALAQQHKSLPLIRDAEIEGLLRDYAAPIFRAAGLGKGAVDIYIVNDSSFNAFATGRRMFVNTGAIETSETPNELIGVLAHETGHIIGGHLARLRDRLDKANIMAVLSMLAGAGAIAMGGNAASAAGEAIALGGQSMIKRGLLAYQRSEEAAADAAAVRLLDATHQSGRGMLKTFERLSQELLFSGTKVDPYIQNHPMPRDRVALLEKTVDRSPYVNVKDPPELQLRHDMARAKIAAYSGQPGELQNLFRDNPSGPAARYGLAISLFLHGSDIKALPIIDRLIAEQPHNAYLYEMKGEMLLRGGAARKAIPAFTKAMKLDRYDTGLMRVELGHAMLETYDPKLLPQATLLIKTGLSRDPTYSGGHGLLARAYAAEGKPDLARAAAAEEAFYAFRFKDSKRLAHLAQPKLKRGSPEWLRIQDILDYKPPKK